MPQSAKTPDKFITRAFTRAANDRRIDKRINQALKNGGQLEIALNGRNGTVSGFLRAAFGHYPQMGYTREDIEGNKAYQEFAERLKTEHNVQITNLTVKDGITLTHTLGGGCWPPQVSLTLSRP